jgi:hypothetical protein
MIAVKVGPPAELRQQRVAGSVEGSTHGHLRPRVPVAGIQIPVAGKTADEGGQEVERVAHPAKVSILEIVRQTLRTGRRAHRFRVYH